MTWAQGRLLRNTLALGNFKPYVNIGWGQNKDAEITPLTPEREQDKQNQAPFKHGTECLGVSNHFTIKRKTKQNPKICIIYFSLEKDKRGKKKKNWDSFSRLPLRGLPLKIALMISIFVY